ncbi:hypothetical protein PtA15_17A343 [Puccinia triticina]|uniref:BZIP domain-containing protein n=1 Tax=Puccinia triticina TaxID=208348 RepID=A0ABY7D947_9BASI|nr:uncharacterized protein PtA15_17A343 [Puccinia triticina]WAQ92861.1 hypothetical protein PtA15_17A343 [Puccinia triticina]
MEFESSNPYFHYFDLANQLASPFEPALHQELLPHDRFEHEQPHLTLPTAIPFPHEPFNQLHQLAADHPTQSQQAAVEPETTGCSNLDPLLSSCTSIDCWIDFTGGESSSPSTASSSPGTTPSLSPTGSSDHPTSPTSGPGPTKPGLLQTAMHLKETARAGRLLIPPGGTLLTRPVLILILSPTLTDSTPTSGPRKKKSEARNEFLERNRLAASRSRAKKKSYQQFLEDQASRLEAEQARLNQIILDLVAEKEHLKRLVGHHHPS